ncbi:uncharacterized protein LOC127833647 [Dreissena polymorpha]|uniref:Glycosyltransferase family 92 protein n=1 Tax=Dreissena polymorpha TaxID=45954 RepID=A0A9D4JDW7_DREPO|nr:uncharacterized protein LOC127833647 [Dreissena polymorpha]KAH3804217.1 hypothetical protein DPMN_132499 [Dreissena polymorpha]
MTCLVDVKMLLTCMLVVYGVTLLKVIKWTDNIWNNVSEFKWIEEQQFRDAMNDIHSSHRLIREVLKRKNATANQSIQHDIVNMISKASLFREEVHNNSILVSEKMLQSIKKMHGNKSRLPQSNYTDCARHFQLMSNEIYIYSAYLELRDSSNDSISVLRILTVSKLDSDDSIVWSINEDPHSWAVATKNEMCDNHAKAYGGVTYTMNLTSSDLNRLLAYRKVHLQTLKNLIDKSSSILSVPVCVNIIHGNLYKTQRLAFRNNSHSTLGQKNTATIFNLFSKGNNPAVSKLSKQQQLLPLNREIMFAVCVPPIFGDIKTSSVIQFVEMQKVLEVDHIYIYSMNSTTKEVSHILKFYEMEKTLTVSTWDIPENVDKAIWYHGQILAVQDCLHRTKNKFHYVAFLDIDELIVPKFHKDFPQMIEEIEQDFENALQSTRTKIAAFKFISAFFNPDYDISSANLTSGHITKGQGQIQMTYFKSLYREPSFSLARTKLIVKPDLIEEMGIHHVSNLSTKESLYIYDVPIETAFIHHYRKCSKMFDTDAPCNHTNLLHDNSILKYESIVRNVFDKVVQKNLQTIK